MSSIEERDGSVTMEMTRLVGHTPCVYLQALNRTNASIVLKMESMNPMMTVKDRVALAIIEKAEKMGNIIVGKTKIVGASSANFGISLAQICAVRGYKAMVVVPESIGNQRRALLRILGAEVILTPASLGMRGAIDLAKKIRDKSRHAFLADQFNSPQGTLVHETTTGPEIWQQTNGKVDVFVAGVGTGGTLIGVARFLKSKNPNCKIIAVEPAESPVLSGGQAGPHVIHGIGAGFVPSLYDRSVVDEVFTVRGEDAMAMSHQLAMREGIFCGFSAGANVWAALRIGDRPSMNGASIVTVIPSFGERYLYTELYEGQRKRSEHLPIIPASYLY